MMEAKEHLKMQARLWKCEARAQAATVRECYQACTGATGEPGDWNGAAPVRAVVAERDWLRNALEHIAGSCEGRAAEVARAALIGPNACLCDCLHVDDLAELLAAAGLDKRPAGM